jgi:tryptophan synthase beta chain
MESAHALAHAVRLAPSLGKNKIIVVNLSGRGDKDAEIISQSIDKK